MVNNILNESENEIKIDMSVINKRSADAGFIIIGNGTDGNAYQHPDGLTVIVSFQVENEQVWCHVSMSRKKKLPSYKDMKRCKSVFIGDDMQAIQIFPKKEKHVNIMEYCLHLWACLGDDGLPDFTRGTGMI